MSVPHLLPLQHTLVGGKYRLGSVIGSGGVGTVYRASHLWTEREVAIKVLDPSLPHFDQLRDAFLREARASVQLQHPNVVDVLDMGEDEAGTTYMVMELLDGPTLRDVLLEQGRLSVDDTAEILLPLVDALEKAHELGIVHKDFKPENIILSVDTFEVMTPKLLDFGVAQVLRDSRPQGRSNVREVIVGTPHYMSPEQAKDQRNLIGPQTDVWGVGLVWYECLTGRCPFDGDTPLQVLEAVCERPIDFEEIPEAQAAVLRGALERSPSERTSSLSILRSQLEDTGALGDPSVVQRLRASSRPPKSERPSYVRRTLQGVGSSDREATGVRSIQLDSELLTLPSASHRRTVIAGLVLAIAVGLGAWWTIASPPTEAVRTPPLTDTREVTPSVEREAKSAEPLQSAELPEEPPALEPPPPVEPTTDLPEPEVARELKPEVPSKPAKPRRPKSRQEVPPPRSYQKPPDLVTEW